MTNMTGAWAKRPKKKLTFKCVGGVMAVAAFVSACNSQSTVSQEDTSRTKSAISSSTSGNDASSNPVSETARVNQRAAQMQQDAAAASRVADQYIVVFKPGVVLGTSGHRIQDIASAVQSRHGGKTIYQYAHALHGLAMKLSPSERDSLSADSQVAYVVPDGIATANTDETNATWGLDRIDQRQLPLNQTYSYPTDGTGVHAYIIDTGINATHTEFGGGPGGSTRIGLGYDFVDNDNDPTDCYGHGTHVAGTIGGTTYGVAKQVTLHGVRVLDCSGSGAWSTVIAGID